MKYPKTTTFHRPPSGNRKRLSGRSRTLLMMLTAVAMAIPASTPAKQAVLATQVGKATYYGGSRFEGRKTASGERFNSAHAVAAHPSWPFGTIVQVTNLHNQRSLQVRIIDRGPGKRARSRGVIIDLSSGSAKVLGFIKRGVTKVRLEVLKWGKKK